MQEVYIVSMARTPIGSFGGGLSSVSAVELGSVAIRHAVQRAGIDSAQVEEVFMGNVISANLGQAPAKQAALGAGLSPQTPTTTINKVCASGMKAIMIAAQTIMTGDNHVVVAGGMESMSRAPFMLDRARYGYGYGNGVLLDAVVRDALQDPYKGYMMGNAGEVCARKYAFTREDQDHYAIQSYMRAQQAYKEGAFADELVAVEVKTRKGSVTVSEDEEYKRFSPEKIPTLRPAFDKDGTITAANASKINDGAAAVVLMSGQKVKELNIKPLAKILSFADASQEPEMFTTTPSRAMPKALHKAGLQVADVDFFEINEAFSVVALANIKEMGLNPQKVNVYGGAVSLGHPVGMSGTRITMTLITALKRKGGKIGCAGICNGGGGASAIVLQLI
ncbi:MAG: acetyl-CoA acetyltransferase [Chitinophagales bacterium]|nr:MAG: acetyl-CoA acetyltransferase [Chitinophagales bacterium]